MNFLWLVAALIALLALTYVFARRVQRRVHTPTPTRNYSRPPQEASAPVQRISLSSAPARSVADQTRVQRRPVESTRSIDSRQDDSTALLTATTLAHTQGWAASDTPRHENSTPAYEPRESSPVVSAIEDDSSRYRTTGGFGGGGYTSVADSAPSHSSSPSYDSSSSSSSGSDYSSSSSDSSSSSFD